MNILKIVNEKTLALRNHEAKEVAKINEAIGHEVNKWAGFANKREQMEAVFKKLHLDITGISGAASTGKSLRVSITAVSDGKFKFIKCRGYTASGRGANQNTLDAKAERMSNAIKEATGFNAAINGFSLETKDGKSDGTVLITLWV